MLVTVGGSAIALVLALAVPTGPSAGIAYLWMASVLLVAVVLIVQRVLVSRHEVTLQSIFGAISAYVIIGLMFSAVYAAISKFGGGAFFADGRPGDVRTFQYFSFTTLTTVGYGDFTAAASGGRAVAVMEALLGQVFLATLGAERPHRRGRAAGESVLSGQPDDGSSPTAGMTGALEARGIADATAPSTASLSCRATWLWPR